MKVDEVAKGLEAGNGLLVRRQPLIDPGLRLGRPNDGRRRGFGPSRSREPSFRLIWTRVRLRRGARRKEAIFVCGSCVQ